MTGLGCMLSSTLVLLVALMLARTVGGRACVGKPLRRLANGLVSRITRIVKLTAFMQSLFVVPQI